MKWTPEAIKKLRERLGLSQYELAEKLGVRQATVSDWENGKHEPQGLAVRALDGLRVHDE